LNVIFNFLATQQAEIRRIIIRETGIAPIIIQKVGDLPLAGFEEDVVFEDESSSSV
jgi:hypothetical protein